jgi:hypothetical protein
MNLLTHFSTESDVRSALNFKIIRLANALLDFETPRGLTECKDKTIRDAAVLLFLRGTRFKQTPEHRITLCKTPQTRSESILGAFPKLRKVT